MPLFRRPIRFHDFTNASISPSLTDSGRPIPPAHLQHADFSPTMDLTKSLASMRRNVESQPSAWKILFEILSIHGKHAR